MIVIDEAQHLNRAALDMLRSLHDRYGVVLRGKFAMWKSLASDAELLAYEAARDRFRGVAP